jgi:pimeloyl-ACP methyl ester carboxylesterase
MDKAIQFRGSKIYYSMTGKGMPVVLIHGFGEDSTIWDDILKDVEEKYLFIIPDIPGSGRSDLIKDKISMNDYAACIKAIIDNEKISSMVMIGHSMGGYISLAFAEDYPGLLRSIGLFHSSTYADDDEKITTRKKAISFIREHGAQSFLKTSLTGLFKDAEKNNNEIEKLLKKGASFTDEALIQYYECMINRPNRTHILKQLPLPFLFIMGEHDKAVPFQHSLEQSQIPAHSYVYILRNSAHMGMLEETDKCRKILAYFLHDVDS